MNHQLWIKTLGILAALPILMVFISGSGNLITLVGGSPGKFITLDTAGYECTDADGNEECDAPPED